ncbi:hypothetical protein PVAP13_2NG333012 [Panicum virgatum]|uniref:Uncharacterized protein n=1 Tax=Panicum virgatum TaxID=38727 RepID=A0A8T0VKN9_PANVG|nr:hypothetical protein PVAP13_2NG333006 [Panicum virgatum]KAG2635407.1 hypothetical protein PVAP13_2NG333009 [Panicum virgatum]KAG2635408.1 hypothetical protein PVAP13_2NG333012 [Panicum virgatum]
MDMMKMGKTRVVKTILSLLLVIILIACQENMGMSVVQASCQINPGVGKCIAACLTPGHCDTCCKNLGHPRGKCQPILACACCSS